MTPSPTERLELIDPTVVSFTATVLRCDADASPGRQRVVLDRSAFYPTSGGQPHDTGTLGLARVVDVVQQGVEVVHVVEGPAVKGSVSGQVDASRRRDHRQQHTGQHLLSAAFEATSGARTVSFHLGAEHSTIDVESRNAVDAESVSRAEAFANDVIERDARVAVTQVPRATLDGEGLRKINVPEGIDPVRIVSIGDVDRSHCGGTHCARSGEIRLVKVIGSEKGKGGLTRISFLCGDRALRDYAQRFETLAAAARVATAAWTEIPTLLGGKLEAIKSLEKAQSRFANEAAQSLAEALVEAGASRNAYVRRFEAASIPFLRTLAQKLVSEGVPAALLAGPSETAGLLAVIVAFPPDGTRDAGEQVRRWIAAHGGRGGGKGTIAQMDGVTAAAFETMAREGLG